MSTESEAQRAVLLLGGPRILNTLGSSAVTVARLEEVALRRHETSQTTEEHMQKDIAAQAKAWRALAKYAAEFGEGRLREWAAAEVETGSCVEVQLRGGQVFRGTWEQKEGLCVVTDFYLQPHRFRAKRIVRLYRFEDADLTPEYQVGKPALVRSQGKVFRGSVLRVTRTRVKVQFPNTDGSIHEEWKRPASNEITTA